MSEDFELRFCLNSLKQRKKERMNLKETESERERAGGKPRRRALQGEEHGARRPPGLASPSCKQHQGLEQQEQEVRG